MRPVGLVRNTRKDIEWRGGIQIATYSSSSGSGGGEVSDIGMIFVLRLISNFIDY